MRKNPKADLISRDNVALGDSFGTPYRLDRLDSVSIRALTNPAKIRFAPEEGVGPGEWTNDAIPIPTGGWTDITESVLAGFSYFQLANDTSGSPATVSIRAFCKGV